MMTGVRLGESAIRDRRIALSCSRDGECGQGMFHDSNPNNEGEMTAGWFQPSPSNAVADTLAPLVHWRLCHVYDWLYFEQDRHGYDVSGIAVVYGDGDVRTGCIGCNLVNDDVPLKRLIRLPEWSHLVPVLELKQLFNDLTKAKWRKRKRKPEIRKDGKYSQNVQRLGPLTMEARAYGLERVLDIQARAKIDLINTEEEARIKQLWQLNTWPDGWMGDEVVGSQPIDVLRLNSGGEIVLQALLIR
jgi:DNA sulfur modification protein DndC